MWRLPALPAVAVSTVTGDTPFCVIFSSVKGSFLYVLSVTARVISLILRGGGYIPVPPPLSRLFFKHRMKQVHSEEVLGLQSVPREVAGLCFVTSKCILLLLVRQRSGDRRYV